MNSLFMNTSPKQAESSSMSDGKKQRKCVTLEVKLDVLRRFEEGQRAVDIAKVHGLAPTTVRTIYVRDAEKIKKRAKGSYIAARKPTRSERVRNRESLLSAGHEDQIQHRATESQLGGQAKTLYNNPPGKEDASPGNGSVTAGETSGTSQEWLELYKNENFSAGYIAEANTEYTFAASNFSAELQELINEGGYFPKQVMNVDETGLFWKRLPARTHISKEEKTSPGFSASKDRLSLLLGGNAEGDFKFKPLLVYHSENPRALNGYSKEHLRVTWRANKKAWITASLFQEWIMVYAIPALKEYCAKENLEFKILMLLDNAPCHPVNLNDLSKNIKFVFLPPNSTCLLQPMDQGVIATFKSYYLRRTFSQLLEATDGEEKSNTRDPWYDYNILKAIENIADAWDEVMSKCMNNVWRNIWPECVYNFEGFEEEIDETTGVCREIADLASQAGFTGMEEVDIVELLASHCEELTKEDLLQLEAQRAEEEECFDETPPSRLLTPKRLSKFFQLIEEAMEIVNEDDPDRERSFRVARAMASNISCYREIYLEKKKAEQKSLGQILQTTPDSQANREELLIEKTQVAMSGEDSGSSDRESQMTPEKTRGTKRVPAQEKMDSKDGSPQSKRSLKSQHYNADCEIAVFDPSIVKEEYAIP